jgi:hypothetical protein
MGLVPKTTKSEVKVFRNLSVTRVIGLIASGGMGLTIGSMLPYDWLQIGLSLAFVILFMIASGKAPTDPTKPFVIGLLQYVTYKLMPKKLYGKNTEEYIEYKERLKAKNEKRKNKKKK